VNNSYNGFVVETFIDELASAAKRIPTNTAGTCSAKRRVTSVP